MCHSADCLCRSPRGSRWMRSVQSCSMQSQWLSIASDGRTKRSSSPNCKRLHNFFCDPVKRFQIPPISTSRWGIRNQKFGFQEPPPPPLMKSDMLDFGTLHPPPPPPHFRYPSLNSSQLSILWYIAHKVTEWTFIDVDRCRHILKNVNMKTCKSLSATTWAMYHNIDYWEEFRKGISETKNMYKARMCKLCVWNQIGGGGFANQKSDCN